jgi:hypothetical protein
MLGFWRLETNDTRTDGNHISVTHSVMTALRRKIIVLSKEESITEILLKLTSNWWLWKEENSSRHLQRHGKSQPKKTVPVSRPPSLAPTTALWAGELRGVAQNCVCCAGHTRQENDSISICMGHQNTFRMTTGTRQFLFCRWQGELHNPKNHCKKSNCTMPLLGLEDL